MNRKRTHPGVVIRKYYLQTHKTSMDNLTVALFSGRTKELLAGKLSVDRKLANKLSRLFGTTRKYWLNLQKNFDESKHGK